MLTSNPFAAVTEYLPAALLQGYIVLMLLAVVAGTLFDVWHKGSAIFFAQRRAKSKADAERQLSGGEAFSLALETIAEAAVSDTLLNSIATSPDINATRAGPPPLYGTCTMSMPARSLSSSAPRCVALPLPPDGSFAKKLGLITWPLVAINSV